MSEGHGAGGEIPRVRVPERESGMERQYAESTGSVMEWKSWFVSRLLRFLLFLAFACAATQIFGIQAHAGLLEFTTSSTLRRESGLPEKAQPPAAKAVSQVRKSRTVQVSEAGQVRSTAQTGQARQAPARAPEKKAEPRRQISDSPSAPAPVTPGLHASPWAFGEGRSAAQWSGRGVAGRDLTKKASGRKKGRGSAVKPEQASRAERFELEVSREGHRWHSRPEKDPAAGMPSERRHRLSAFATVEDEKRDMSFGLGPELIVRDPNQESKEFTQEKNMPDVEPGVGMRFRLAF